MGAEGVADPVQQRFGGEDVGTAGDGPELRLAPVVEGQHPAFVADEQGSHAVGDALVGPRPSRRSTNTRYADLPAVCRRFSNRSATARQVQFETGMSSSQSFPRLPTWRQRGKVVLAGAGFRQLYPTSRRAEEMVTVNPASTSMKDMRVMRKNVEVPAAL